MGASPLTKEDMIELAKVLGWYFHLDAYNTTTDSYSVYATWKRTYNGTSIEAERNIGANKMPKGSQSFRTMVVVDKGHAPTLNDLTEYQLPKMTYTHMTGVHHVR